MKKKIIYNIGSVLLIINTSLFIISLSIAFTLLFKPFYYWHIDCLNIVETSGYSRNEIKEAYDDVYNYLILNKEFKTGKLSYSMDGYDHFKDCKTLFRINFIILGVSFIIILLKLKFFNKIKVYNHNIGFCSSCLNIYSFFMIFMFIFIIGFDFIFDLFHNIFFLGKNNWLLDRDVDEIIRILPEEYFRNCFILVILIIFIISLIILLREIHNKKND